MTLELTKFDEIIEFIWDNRTYVTRAEVEDGIKRSTLKFLAERDEKRPLYVNLATNKIGSEQCISQ